MSRYKLSCWYYDEDKVSLRDNSNLVISRCSLLAFSSSCRCLSLTVCESRSACTWWRSWLTALRLFSMLSLRCFSELVMSWLSASFSLATKSSLPTLLRSDTSFDLSPLLVAKSCCSSFLRSRSFCRSSTCWLRLSSMLWMYSRKTRSTSCACAQAVCWFETSFRSCEIRTSFCFAASSSSLVSFYWLFKLFSLFSNCTYKLVWYCSLLFTS